MLDLHTVLKNYNDNPQDAWTNYNAAKYFADINQHDLACVFLQPIVATPRNTPAWAACANQFTISGYYSQISSTKHQAQNTCEYLATKRYPHDESRWLARQNNVWYAAPLKQLASSWQCKQVNFVCDEGWVATNPSICAHDGKIYMIQRTVNYVIDDQGSYIPQTSAYAITKNYFLTLGLDLSIQSACAILPPESHPDPVWPYVQGFEDSRLFFWNNEPWCSSTVRDQHVDGLAQQILTRLSPQDNHYRMTHTKTIRPDFCPETYEKNWMPFVLNNQLRFIYSSDPVRIVDDNGQLVWLNPVSIKADNFRGGQVLKYFAQGYLAVIHESSIHGTTRKYLHRFVWYNQGFRMMRYSAPFYLTQLGIEFVAGLTRHPLSQDIIISFGVNDCESWLGTVSEADVWQMMQFTA